jgi:hypothetical protein
MNWKADIFLSAIFAINAGAVLLLSYSGGAPAWSPVALFMIVSVMFFAVSMDKRRDTKGKIFGRDQP